MSLIDISPGGYYDDTGHWVQLKHCFVYCGASCTCSPPGGVFYSEAHDKSKQCCTCGVGTNPPRPHDRSCPLATTE